MQEVLDEMVFLGIIRVVQFGAWLVMYFGIMVIAAALQVVSKKKADPWGD